MADLGNSKIKDTYTLVLQTDASGNLQKLDGTTPSPFIVNGNLRYVDGNQASNYILTSDGSGNASWAENSHASTLWSANTDGSISPSGLTTNIGLGTSTPNKPLTVVGDISGTTDLYIDGNIEGATDLQLGSSTHTASTITAEESLTIKGRGVDNDFMILKQDRIQLFLDGLEFATITSLTHPSAAGGVTFNSSNRDYDFKILGDDVVIFQTDAVRSSVRLKDHLTIGNSNAVDWNESEQWGLSVTGSSLFYDGGSNNTNANAISAVGNISGTTNLYIGGISASTVSAASITSIGFVGDITGNADTATKIASITNSNIVQLDETQTLTNKTLTNPTLTTPNIGTPTAGNLGSCSAYPGDSSLVIVGTVEEGTWASNRKFEISTIDIGNGEGDIIYFGLADTDLTLGGIYTFDGTKWISGVATAVATSTKLLGVALGTAPDEGMLIRGMVTLANTPGGSDGDVIYLSTAASKATSTIPSDTGEVVRIVGYAIDTSNAQIWFDPDKTWVELS